MRGLAFCPLLLVAAAFCADNQPAGSPSTRTGWFGDAACTRERVQAGNIDPNNPDCAKKCVKNGSALGFIELWGLPVKTQAQTQLLQGHDAGAPGLLGLPTPPASAGAASADQLDAPDTAPEQAEQAEQHEQIPALSGSEAAIGQ